MKWKHPRFEKYNLKNNRLTQRIPERFRDPKRNRQTFNSMLPNIATLMALCTGLTAVRLALENRYDLAVLAILVAGLLDAMDGKLARYLGSTSRFGAELDSLSDFISFGVSPALIVYLKTLHTLGGIGWIFSLLFSVCMGLRLARFNTFSIEGAPDNWPEEFFMGVPAPGAALIGITPIIMDLAFQQYGFGHFMINPYFNAAILCIASSLMVSRIPTFSIKKLHIPHTYVVPILLLTAVFVGVIIIEPWIVLSCISISYMCLIPFSIRAFKKLRRTGG